MLSNTTKAWYVIVWTDHTWSRHSVEIKESDIKTLGIESVVRLIVPKSDNVYSYFVDSKQRTN